MSILPIYVPCQICKTDMPMSDIKNHILDECIPTLLEIYGLKNLLPTQKEYQSFEELGISFDSEYDSSTCFLSQYFLEDHAKKQYCTNPIRGSLRIDIINGTFSTTICKFEHLSEIKTLNLIRSTLRAQIFHDYLKEDLSKVKEQGRIGRCSTCSNKCSDWIKIKPSGLTKSSNTENKIFKRKVDDIDDSSTNISDGEPEELPTKGKTPSKRGKISTTN
ncbi:hypothetical protein RB653_002803 [Dictyostelium firmibasis]|uniref:Uncharacterized protein n=1 Tax=Dictyostelium firmibasis TaxID=79012 RepID=A0AAN7TYW6_9MYCE